jgi:two-component system, OmpR family, alkaline phosphatase synthesis response regulator PhoP
MSKILLIEDEESIASMLQLNLELEGISVLSIADGKLAKKELQFGNFDLVVLDVMLPTINGIELCQISKKMKPNLPILILSALDSGDDRISGLKAGADDYMTKPFRLEEFLIRVKNLLKRNATIEVKNDWVINGHIINFDAFEIISKTEGAISLTKREAMFLKMLIEKPNVVIRREEILERLWDMQDSPSARTIDNFILNFRKIFELDSKQPEHFIAVRGVGYMFKT